MIILQFVGSGAGCREFIRTQTVKELLKPGFIDNPQLPISESVSVREPVVADLKQAEDSLYGIGFDTFEEFVEHNADLTITRTEFVGMWDEYQNNSTEPAWNPSPEDVYGREALM